MICESKRRREVTVNWAADRRRRYRIAPCRRQHQEHRAIERRADAKIEYSGLGVVDDVQRPGLVRQDSGFGSYPSNDRAVGPTGARQSHYDEATQTTTGDDHAVFFVSCWLSGVPSTPRWIQSFWHVHGRRRLPNRLPVSEPRQQMSPWFRRTAVGMLAFLTISFFSASLAHAVPRQRRRHGLKAYGKTN